MTLLEVKNLKVEFVTVSGSVKAIDGVSFTVNRGEVVGVVGESGSGKTTLGLAILKILPLNGRIVSGEIIFDGRDLVKLSEEDMTKVRGKEISMIFQDPMTSLNPTMRIVDHVAEALIVHYRLSKEEARSKAIEALTAVGIPENRVLDYPHQLSGGMRQRVMIAISYALKPKLLIADEPTTALDVIVQDQILDLLKELRNRQKTSILFITHDLSVVADIADRVIIMYAGKIMEIGSVEQIYYSTLHPYTQGLLKSIPKIGSNSDLYTIPGNPPDMLNPPPGCRFHPRCPFAEEKCRKENPPLVEVSKGHYVACWRCVK